MFYTRKLKYKPGQKKNVLLGFLVQDFTEYFRVFCYKISQRSREILYYRDSKLHKGTYCCACMSQYRARQEVALINERTKWKERYIREEITDGTVPLGIAKGNARNSVQRRRLWEDHSRNELCRRWTRISQKECLVLSLGQWIHYIWRCFYQVSAKTRTHPIDGQT